MGNCRWILISCKKLYTSTQLFFVAVVYCILYFLTSKYNQSTIIAYHKFVWASLV